MIALWATRYCSQTAWAKQVTDSNGNQISFKVPMGSATVMDTVGRTWPLSSDSSTTDYSGCVSSYPIFSAGLDNYTAPDGTVRSMKICTAQIPLQSFFNQAGIIEYQNYSTPQPMTAIVTVFLASSIKRYFAYDNYGMITRL